MSDKISTAALQEMLDRHNDHISASRLTAKSLPDWGFSAVGFSGFCPVKDCRIIVSDLVAIAPVKPAIMMTEVMRSSKKGPGDGVRFAAVASDINFEVILGQDFELQSVEMCVFALGNLIKILSESPAIPRFSCSCRTMNEINFALDRSVDFKPFLLNAVSFRKNPPLYLSSSDLQWLSTSLESMLELLNKNLRLRVCADFFGTWDVSHDPRKGLFSIWACVDALFGKNERSSAKKMIARASDFCEVDAGEVAEMYNVRCAIIHGREAEYGLVVQSIEVALDLVRQALRKIINTRILPLGPSA